jgi:hypothetical protein
MGAYVINEAAGQMLRATAPEISATVNADLFFA